MDPFVIGALVVALALIGLATMAFLSGRGNILRRHIVVTGFGSPAVNLALEIATAMSKLNIWGIVLKWAVDDDNVTTEAARKALRKIVPRGILFEAEHGDQQSVGGYRGSKLRAMSRKHIWAPLVSQVNDAIVGAARRLRLIDPDTIQIAGWTGGHITLTLNALRDRVRDLEEELKLLVLVLSHQATRRSALRKTADLPYQLKREKLVTTTLLMDNLSGLVQMHREATETTAEERGHGVAAMDLRVGIALAGAGAASSVFNTQTAFTDIVDTLGKYRAMTGMSFGNRHLRKIDASFWHKLTGWLVTRTPAWLPEDLLATARRAGEDALNVQVGNATIDAAPLSPVLCEWYLIMTVPLPINDTRWEGLRAAFGDWLSNFSVIPDEDDIPEKNRRKQITVIWMPGEGAPEFGNEQADFSNIQGAAWWPLLQTRIAEPVQAVIDSPDNLMNLDDEEEGNN